MIAKSFATESVIQVSAIMVEMGVGMRAPTSAFRYPR
jgi:hypothetical protein